SQPWRAHGQNLRARLYYDASGPRYSGSLSVAPVRIATRNPGIIDVRASAEISLDRDRIRLSRTDLRAGKSELRLSNVTIENFKAPVITAAYEAHAYLADFTRAQGEVEAAGELRYV